MTSALVTVYHPENTVRDNVRRIARQVDVVYLCDNSSTSNEGLFAEMEEADKIRYVFFGENLGLSLAFNRILNDPHIPWQEEDYVLFFDQDSQIEEGHIPKLTEVYESLKQAGIPVGCLGPAYLNTSDGQMKKPKSKDCIQEGTYSVTAIITSSMLTTYGAMRSVGFWNEALFLDVADLELCWRMLQAGMVCCQTEQIVFQHAMGTGRKGIGFLHFGVWSPVREYYQVREALYMLGKSYTPLKNRVRFLLTALVRPVVHLIFLDRRRERFHYIIRGYADFFHKKTGRIEEETA